MTSESKTASRPSMNDVAAAAGVSKAAVSKVIRNAYGVSADMRQRVEAAISDLGYRPKIAARAMRGSGFTIGFEIPQLGNDFFTQVMEGAAEELADSGYQLIIAPAMGEVKGARVLNALVDRQVDGFVAISPEVAPDWLESLGRTVPIVLLGRHDASVNYDTITNDDTVGATLAMEHLVALGHRQIAHITVTGAEGVPADVLPHELRRRVYESTMKANGWRTATVASGPLEPDAYQAAMQLLGASNRPTAIFAANDTLAIGALRARNELNLSPEELSIIGYDDIDLAAHPIASLSTIDQFGRETGRRSVQMLLERIRDERDSARHEMLTPELRVRASTAPLLDQGRTVERS